MIFFVVRVVHLLSMVIWLGAGFSVPALADIDRSLSSSPEQHGPLLERLKLIKFVVVPAAVFTVITGVMLVQLRGGFFAVSWRFSAALGLAISTFILGGAVSQKAIDAMATAIGAGNLEAAKVSARKFRRTLRVEELIRVAIFLLMVLPL